MSAIKTLQLLAAAPASVDSEGTAVGIQIVQVESHDDIESDAGLQVNTGGDLVFNGISLTGDDSAGGGG